MKIVIAMVRHETNSFSPMPTRYEDFGPHGPLLGPEVYAAYRNSGAALSGLIAVAEEAGTEISTPIAARALPSAPVEQGAFDRLARVVCDAVSEGCDALFLDLHGAMVTEAFDDAEGELLARIRAIAPDLPIAVALDFHANTSALMVANATVISAYRTYPHTDMVETGRRAGRLLLASIAGRNAPSMAWQNLPLLPNVLCQVTDSGPMSEVMAAARSAEAEAALEVAVFGGFPLADAAEAGFSVIVTTDGDPDAARRIGRHMCDLAWARRAGFTARFEPLAQSIGRAKSLAGRPVLLVDHADNCNSGGSQDTMEVIAEALAQGLEEIAAGPISDPEAVAAMVAAGIGARVEVAVGGKYGIPAIGRSGRQLQLSGVVRNIAEGRFTVSGPVFTGMQATLGRTVLLDTGPLLLVVSEGRMEPLDLGIFRCVGIEPLMQRFLIIKSKVQYKPTFGAIAKHIILCNGAGAASADLGLFRFTKLRRPIHPLDLEA